LKSHVKNSKLAFHCLLNCDDIFDIFAKNIGLVGLTSHQLFSLCKGYAYCICIML